MAIKLETFVKRLNTVDQALLSMKDDITVSLVKRTKSGKDMNNKPFKPYSKGYKKKNRNVNLTVKGTMLGNITSKKIKDGIVLYFSSKSENAKAVSNSKTRQFFGLDKKQIKSIVKRLQKYLHKR